MAIVIVQTLEDGDGRELLEAENTEVGVALASLELMHRWPIGLILLPGCWRDADESLYSLGNPNPRTCFVPAQAHDVLTSPMAAYVNG